MTGNDANPGRTRPLGPVNDHYWLLLRMAHATGVDLDTAFRNEALLVEDWAGLVTKCRSCQWAEGCQRWLDKPVDDLRALPETCVNRRTLAALQASIEDTER